MQFFEALVEYLVHHRRPTHPNPRHFAPIRVQFLRNVILVPPAGPNELVGVWVFLGLGVAHDQLEVVEAQFLVQVEEGLAQVETYRVLLVLERHVQVELEVVTQH